MRCGDAKPVLYLFGHRNASKSSDLQLFSFVWLSCEVGGFFHDIVQNADFFVHYFEIVAVFLHNLRDGILVIPNSSFLTSFLIVTILSNYYFYQPVYFENILD
jgi:hypothetical protein